uniref:Uncharacterized protein n=1 Tax=Romanomermis culicivorax TaxID=13658 RepID=A0A915HM70_ROMCU
MCTCSTSGVRVRRGGHSENWASSSINFYEKYMTCAVRLRVQFIFDNQKYFIQSRFVELLVDSLSICQHQNYRKSSALDAKENPHTGWRS